MKRFLQNISFFVFTILIISFFADRIISKQLKKSKTHALGEIGIWDNIYNGEINSEILIYGSSRASVHINPEIIEKGLDKITFNLGIDGHNFWLQYLRHKAVLKFDRKPGYILLSVDVWSLQKREELYNSDQFLPFMFFNKEIFKFTHSYTGFSIFDYFLPLVRYYGRQKAIKVSKDNFLGSSLSNFREKGFLPMNKNWNEDFDEAKNTMEFYDLNLHAPSIRLFDEFLKECQENDIHVVLIYTPEYIEGQKFIRNRKDVITIFNDFSSKYGIPFINYSSDSICFDKQYFYNAMHLNARGAEIFTKILLEDIMKMNLIENAKELN